MHARSPRLLWLGLSLVMLTAVPASSTVAERWVLDGFHASAYNDQGHLHVWYSHVRRAGVESIGDPRATRQRTSSEPMVCAWVLAPYDPDDPLRRDYGCSTTAPSYQVDPESGQTRLIFRVITQPRGLALTGTITMHPIGPPDEDRALFIERDDDDTLPPGVWTGDLSYAHGGGDARFGLGTPERRAIGMYGWSHRWDLLHAGEDAAAPCANGCGMPSGIPL